MCNIATCPIPFLPLHGAIATAAPSRPPSPDPKPNTKERAHPKRYPDNTLPTHTPQEGKKVNTTQRKGEKTNKKQTERKRKSRKGRTGQQDPANGREEGKLNKDAFGPDQRGPEAGEVPSAGEGAAFW